MDEMLPFLRAVAANPGDDAPRLAFADWLTEHDQPARADFIRLQIELARTDPADDGYAEKTARMRRCGVLTQKGKHRFFDHLPTKKLKIAFRRGFIEAIDTADADRIDTSGFDLVPLQALRTGAKHVAKFEGFTRLKWLEYWEKRDAKPAQLLEILGPGGPFKNLETLSLPYLTAAHFEAGVIPQFDLPKLRNFYIETGEFSYLSVPVPRDDDHDDDDYSRGHPWGGLPDYLPRNALPNPKTPLERFVWHGDDDSDLFGDDGWEWRGPTMEALLAHLKTYRDLKQVEVAVDYDDHESGGEGVRTAPYQQNPLELAPTLECVTLSGHDLRLLSSSKRKLKALRVYESGGGDLFALLRQPVCAGLESFHADDRHGEWGRDQTPGPGATLPKLKSLYLSTPPLARFSNFQFPNLVSLLGFNDVNAMLARKWPKLQTLDLSFKRLSDLKAFAQSDCCPMLTTLNIGEYYEDYYKSAEIDFSFLANCPHMPLLSLVRIAGYPQSRTCVVADGELVPVRDDVMLDGLAPSTPYRFPIAF